MSSNLLGQWMNQGWIARHFRDAGVTHLVHTQPRISQEEHHYITLVALEFNPHLAESIFGLINMPTQGSRFFRLGRIVV